MANGLIFKEKKKRYYPNGTWVEVPFSIDPRFGQGVIIDVANSADSIRGSAENPMYLVQFETTEYWMSEQDVERFLL